MLAIHNQLTNKHIRGLRRLPMLIKFEAHCFRSLCRAAVIGDPTMARRHLPSAYKAIHEALCQPEISKRDCESLRRALRYLNVIETRGSRAA
jgi:hypothetical protein